MRRGGFWAKSTEFNSRDLKEGKNVVWDALVSCRPIPEILLILSRIRFAQKATAIEKITGIRYQWNFVTHNRARGEARDGATEGRPKGRDERDRASQIKRIFTNGERRRRRFSLLVSLVFVQEIGGSNIQRMDIRVGWVHSLVSADQVFCGFRVQELVEKDSECSFMVINLFSVAYDFMCAIAMCEMIWRKFSRKSFDNL
jgi:hypothetical protein